MEFWVWGGFIVGRLFVIILGSINWIIVMVLGFFVVFLDIFIKFCGSLEGVFEIY